LPFLSEGFIGNVLEFTLQLLKEAKFFLFANNTEINKNGVDRTTTVYVFGGARKQNLNLAFNRF